jgi:Fe2+ or Zn2+ uptake regulation protein
VADVAAGTLIDALRADGFRVTAPRRAICEALAERHDDHLTASSLHVAAELRSGAPIDISTVYRTIDALEHAGLLHHVHLGHGPAVLHLSDHLQHHHLTCEVCGLTVDIGIDELEQLTESVAERHGFTIDSAHFALIGRCREHGQRATLNNE